MEALYQPVLPRSPAPFRSPAPALSHWVDFSYSFGHNCLGRMAPFKLPALYAQAAHSPLPLGTEIRDPLSGGSFGLTMCNKEELTSMCSPSAEMHQVPLHPAAHYPHLSSTEFSAQLRGLTGLPSGLQFGKDPCQEVHPSLLMTVSMGQARGGKGREGVCCHPLPGHEY